MTETKLTSRQKTVVDGIKGKKTPQAIAAEMGISVNGVYGHMHRLRKAGLIPTTSRRAPSRNGSRRNARANNPVVEALRVAHAQADNRLKEIDSSIAGLEGERKAILTAVK